MLAGIVQTVTSQEHGLDDDVPLEHLQIFDYILHVVVRLLRAVQLLDVIHIHGIQFQDVVIHEHQRLSLPPYIYRWRC